MSFYEKFKNEISSIYRKIVDDQYWYPILPIYADNNTYDYKREKYDFRISGVTETRNNYKLFFTFGSGHFIFIGHDNVLYYQYKDMKLNLDELTEEEHFQISTVQDTGDTTFEELLDIKKMYHSLQKLVPKHCERSLEKYNQIMDDISNSCRGIVQSQVNK